MIAIIIIFTSFNLIDAMGIEIIRAGDATPEYDCPAFLLQHVVDLLRLELFRAIVPVYSPGKEVHAVNAIGFWHLFFPTLL